MSRSSAGTKKTTNSINQDSSRYIERERTGQRKCGEGGVSDASHIFSYGLMNAIGTHTRGRPMTSSLDEFHRDMNHETNLRLKSQYGNRVLDERRDARIADAFVNNRSIQGQTTANRAYQVKYLQYLFLLCFSRITSAYLHRRRTDLHQVSLLLILTLLH
jgi:hypothetical protein